MMPAKNVMIIPCAIAAASSPIFFPIGSMNPANAPHSSFAPAQPHPAPMAAASFSAFTRIICALLTSAMSGASLNSSH